MEQRLQKIISAAGLMSRRAAEELIEKGRVSVNGRTASLGDRAEPGRDRIELDGRPIGAEEEKVYIMLNKPRGYVTTMHDEKGRRNVSELVADIPQRLYPVGRLDMNSEGLLIMTNDGELANRLMHPSGETVKRYRTSVRGENIALAAEKLRCPMLIDGYETRPAEVGIVRESGDSAVLLISIHEGRNRQIRKMCEQAGLKVTRLCRVSEGGVELGSLKSGCWRRLSRNELERLRHTEAADERD